MTDKIRVGIVGYGNLGKGAEAAIRQSQDFELVTIFNKRSQTQLDEMKKYLGEIDFMLLCVGSSVDIPKQAPEVVKMFNTVDTYDTHAKIQDYFHTMDQTARVSGKLAMISVGWDPGLFSLMRVLTEASLPKGKTNTFWGWGVSQGHSEALKRIPGVEIGRAYTIPVEETLEAVRRGEQQDFSPRQMHRRDCYVVAEEGADREQIRQTAVSLPNYFAPNDTSVTFVDRQTFQSDHGILPHGGFVIRSGVTGDGGNQEIMEFRLKLDSNPEFTASVMLSYCRAAWRFFHEGRRGALTVFDVPIAYLTPKDGFILRSTML